MKLNTKSLAEVEIGIPVLAAGVYHARMEKIEVKPNKRGDGNNLYIMFRVMDPEVPMHKDGSVVKNTGQCCISRYFSLTPSDSYDPDKAMKELAVAINLPPVSDLNVEDLANKLVNIKVAYKAAEGAYQEGNDVQRVTPIKTDDAFTPPPF